MSAPRLTHLSCAMALGLSIVACPAHAQPTDANAAAAEALFQDARRLAEAKKFGEACPKFLASHKLAPGVGTLLNLADCYEKNGQIASAWARFHEAIALAQRANRADREKIARERADKLEPRLIKLTVTAKDSTVEVRLDGNVLDSAVLGTPLPVDPGRHNIEASAKDKKTYKLTVDVSERSKSPTVEIPSLDDDSSGSSSTTTSPVSTGPTRSTGGDTVETPATTASSLSGQQVAAIVLAGVGVVSLGIGSYFGIQASKKWEEAKGYCNTAYECLRPGVDLTEEAKTAGNVSTVTFILGGALVATGAILFFTSQRNERKTKLGIGPGSIMVGGTF